MDCHEDYMFILCHEDETNTRPVWVARALYQPVFVTSGLHFQHV